MKYRAINYLVQTSMLYIGLRLVSELVYIVYCLVIGVTFDNGVMQVLKYISLGAATVLVVLLFIDEKKELQELSEKTGYSFDTVAYAKFKMYMSPEWIIREWNLEQKVKDHRSG